MCLFSDHLVVKQGKGVVVVILPRVEEIQPITRLPLHTLHTLHQQEVVEERVEGVRDQEDQVVLEEAQTLDQEGPEEVRTLVQVVVEEVVEALVVAAVDRQNQIRQEG